MDIVSKTSVFQICHVLFTMYYILHVYMYYVLETKAYRFIGSEKEN